LGKMYLQAAKADFHIAHCVFCFQARGTLIILIIKEWEY
jgi:hypothetical protein